jgi:predicted translation initiation factor SUI1
LFLGSQNHTHAPVAVQAFNTAAKRMGLPWTAISRGLAADATDPATADDLAAAACVIVLNREEEVSLLRERFANYTDTVEFWEIASGTETPIIIEREVNALIARLLGGGERPEALPPPSAPKPAKLKLPIKPVKVGRETAGRRGKGVTVVWDLPLCEAELQQLATQLKAKCGTGGTVKDGRIEIQGDQRNRVVVELEKLGYTVKRSGG